MWGKITHIEAKMIYNLCKSEAHSFKHGIARENHWNFKRAFFRQEGVCCWFSAIFLYSAELYFERTVALTGSSVVSGV